jgi:hypothetical protein
MFFMSKNLVQNYLLVKVRVACQAEIVLIES